MAPQITTLKMEQKFKKTPAGIIPVDWEYLRIADLAQLINGHGFGPQDWKASGIPIIRIQNLNGGLDYNYYQGPIEDEWLVCPGDLLFSWSGSLGTSFGPYIWKGPKAVLNQHIFVVKNHASVDRGYLYQILRSVTTSIEQRAHGSAGLVHVTKRELEGFFVPVPPANEQKGIAEILSAVDEAIEKTRAIIDKSRTLRRGVMRQIFGEAKEQGQPTKNMRLGDLCELITKGTTPTTCGFKYTESGVRFIKVESIDVSGRLVLQNSAYISKETHQALRRSMLQAGDILFSIAGALGRSAIVTPEILPANTNQALAIIRLKREKADVLYVRHFLDSAFTKRFITGNGTQGAQINLSLAQVADIRIPLPGIERQRMDAQTIFGLDQEIAAQEVYASQIESVKKALMSVLLTGKVRVKI